MQNIQKEMTELEKLVDKKLSEMVRDKPVEFIMAMLAIMGKMCVETNAETMNLSQESTIENQRYEIKCKISLTKIKTK